MVKKPAEKSGRIKGITKEKINFFFRTLMSRINKKLCKGTLS
jgi:hypothetical protein